MEAPKPITPTESKKRDFPISIGNDNCIFSIVLSTENIQFIIKKENDSAFKFEKSLTFEQLNKISKWFKIFDSLEEVYVDIIKLMEKKQINIDLEQNSVNLKFNINMEKIKEFDLLLEQKELSKDEIIHNLIKDNKELKKKVEHLEKKMNDYEKRLNIIEEKLSNKKDNVLQAIQTKGNNDIFNSDIINEEDKNTLNNWINLNNNKKIKLLYKASRDGDSYQDFYRLCEDKGPTITIALSKKGYKFGGFTKLSWKNPNNGKDGNKFYEDNEAFIFSLNKKRKYYPKIEDKKYAVCMWSDRGPSFGNGNDLTLHNNCLHNNNSYNNCPDTYQIEKCGLNGGEYNFTVKDYEVYSVS